MIKGKFTPEEAELFQKLEAKKAPIQARLDELKAIVQSELSTQKMVKDARNEIFEVQKGLVPFAEMQAGMASPMSRDKYFPDLSKNALIEKIKAAVA